MNNNNVLTHRSSSYPSAVLVLDAASGFYDGRSLVELCDSNKRGEIILVKYRGAANLCSDREQRGEQGGSEVETFLGRCRTPRAKDGAHLQHFVDPSDCPIKTTNNF
mmetsp:Transcript_37437/g.120098  ORF Transcript_37437/g.120098 Transcript_37437/m.120098 type:complete len:107 (-) Transcript_37437:1174-1494(-)